jgi:3-deoxy-D-manno-octulosonic-acid transferase
MLLRIYGWITTLLVPLLRRKLARRALAEPGYGEAVEERFGGYTMAPLVGGKVVWVHAVSLGETRAVAALVQALRREIPAMRLLLTHGTATGREAGKALLQTGDVQVWQPWDCPLAVQRFVEQFRPRIGLLVETEVWPLLTAECKKQGVPLCLVNARLSDKSLRQARRLGPLAPRPTAASRRCGRKARPMHSACGPWVPLWPVSWATSSLTCSPPASS